MHNEEPANKCCSKAGVVLAEVRKYPISILFVWGWGGEGIDMPSAP